MVMRTAHPSSERRVIPTEDIRPGESLSVVRLGFIDVTGPARRG